MKRLANNISNYIASELKYGDEKREVISYGLEIFLGTSSKTISILLLAYILNIFKSTLVASISFVAFRRVIGGSHSDTYNKCYFLSIFLMLLSGILGEIITLQGMYIIILILQIYMLAFIATVLWVPAGTEKKMIKNKTTRKKIKIKTIILLTIWAILFSLLTNMYLFKYTISSILGVTLAFFLATPLGYRFMSLKLFKSKY